MKRGRESQRAIHRERHTARAIRRERERVRESIRLLLYLDLLGPLVETWKKRERKRR